MKILILLSSLFLALNLHAITSGEIPKAIQIAGEDGGLVEDGSLWNSSTLKDKVFVMFYVDPDEKDVNEHYSQALKKAKDEDGLQFQSIAIINLAATWKPNFIIEKILKAKQEEFPNTIYVKDKNSVLVKEWDLANDASDILIFSKEGKLLFYKVGKMQEEDIKKSFEIIKGNE